MLADSYYRFPLKLGNFVHAFSIRQILLGCQELEGKILYYINLILMITSSEKAWFRTLFLSKQQFDSI